MSGPVYKFVDTLFWIKIIDSDKTGNAWARIATEVFYIFLCGEITIDQQFGQKFGQPLTVGQMLKLNQEQETKLIVFSFKTFFFERAGVWVQS